MEDVASEIGMPPDSLSATLAVIPNKLSFHLEYHVVSKDICWYLC